MIGENEILFLNWENINQADNIYIRENEQEFNLENILHRTKDEGHILILIIDESHHAAGADNTRKLVNLINAKVTVELSATPKISCDETVTVYREHVIAAFWVRNLLPQDEFIGMRFLISQATFEMTFIKNSFNSFPKALFK